MWILFLSCAVGQSNQARPEHQRSSQRGTGDGVGPYEENRIMRASRPQTVQDCVRDHRFTPRRYQDDRDDHDDHDDDEESRRPGLGLMVMVSCRCGRPGGPGGLSGPGRRGGRGPHGGLPYLVVLVALIVFVVVVVQNINGTAAGARFLKANTRRRNRQTGEIGAGERIFGSGNSLRRAGLPPENSEDPRDEHFARFQQQRECQSFRLSR